MTEVCFPGVVIAPIEYFDVAVIAHVVIETNHLIIAITQIVLLTGVVMKVIDPFDSDPYVHVNAVKHPKLFNAMWSGSSVGIRHNI